MNEMQLYDLADALQIKLVVEDRKISSHPDAKPKKLKFGDLVLPAPCKIVSAVAPSSGAAVLLQVVGKLGLLACVDKTPTEITVLVLDLTKLPDEGAGLFEARQPNDMLEAAQAVSDAIVEGFWRSGKKSWKPLTLTPEAADVAST